MTGRSAPEAQDPPHWSLFDQLNKLVDTHLATLPSPELKVALVLLRHSDTDGTSFPSTHTIATKAGMSVRNAERALQALAARGWLISDGTAGGRGQTALRRLTVPDRTIQTPAHCAGVFTQNPGAARHKTPAHGDAKPRRSQTQNPGAVRRTEQLIEQPREGIQCNNNSRAPVVVAVGEKQPANVEHSEEQEVGAILLRQHKIAADSARKLAAQHPLARIREVCDAADGRHRVEDPAGWISDALTKGWTVIPLNRGDDTSRPSKAINRTNANGDGYSLPHARPRPAYAAPGPAITDQKGQ